MVLDPTRLARAALQQRTAATDSAGSVLLVAGPGTGKSRTIQDRVRHLASSGVPTKSIFAVSFTRAASADLRKGIQQNCKDITGVDDISVSTLHSLALRILKRANRLSYFPVEPRILDDWEQENVFDTEFSAWANFKKKRCGEIRVHVESIWNTGRPPLPFISSPATAISSGEERAFNSFHGTRGQTYACMLPGQPIRTCVDAIVSGNLDPIQLLALDHLIVDEYQDLSPCDIDFVGHLKRLGAGVFICGDDDQSIYSFRYGDPSGIQRYASTNAGTTSHTLADCFRCAHGILATADAILTAHSPPARLQKNLSSVYTNSRPVVPGVVHRAIFSSDTDEAQFVANSCARLIAAGVGPEKILVLLASKKTQKRVVVEAMDALTVPYDFAGQDTLTDYDEGRFLLAQLRVLKNPDDWASHRVLLGLMPGVGPGTCSSICDKVVQNNLRFVNVFRAPLPAQIFSARETRAIAGVAAGLTATNGWSPSDTLDVRLAALMALAPGKPVVIAHIQREISQWPPGMTLDELRLALETSGDQDFADLMASVNNRISSGSSPNQRGSGDSPAIVTSVSAVAPQRVRIMTLHTSKGLTADVVFIPALEESILPGAKRAAYAGQVQEAARLLYVGVTRARAACFLSYARRRWLNGSVVPQTPSRFANCVGGAFAARTAAITPSEIAAITSAISLM